jgi:succinate dehydrogenase/fumarate reductase cytochrome b subunit
MQLESDVAGNRALLRVQAISGLLFAGFLFLHLFNPMLAALGPETYSGAQRTLRRGYQSPPVQIALVIGPMLVHAAAGVLRIIRRRRQQKAAPGPSILYTRLHRKSGIIPTVIAGRHE